MKSKKLLAVAGITMSAALLLAACSKTEKKQMLLQHFHTYMPSIHQHWTIALLVKVQHRTSLLTWSTDSWKMTNTET